MLLKVDEEPVLLKVVIAETDDSVVDMEDFLFILSYLEN